LKYLTFQGFSMKLSEYCKQEGVTLPLVIIGRIVGKHPNYLNELWKKGEVERVKNYIREAEDRFKDICL